MVLRTHPGDCHWVKRVNLDLWFTIRKINCNKPCETCIYYELNSNTVLGKHMVFSKEKSIDSLLTKLRKYSILSLLKWNR